MQLGEVRLYTARNGRCTICDCSAFRHTLIKPLYLVQCQFPCPSSTIRAYNSDLAGLSLPQVCDPGVRLPCQVGGPVTLELHSDALVDVLRLEAPVVTVPRTEGPVTEAARQSLYDMQDGRCNGCFKKQALCKLTDDHRVPKSRGGLKEIGNIELMCAPCNREKDNRGMYSFLWARYGREVMRRLPTLRSPIEEARTRK